MSIPRNRPSRRRRVLLWGILALAGYFALFGGEYGATALWRLEHTKTLEEEQLEALRDEVEELRERAESLENDATTIERIARERYGLTRDGERLYRFVEGAAEDSTTKTTDD